ncbi:MAG: hypothetical protein WA437_02115 [Candidatus Sulfotelmatobacter sp.]
MKGFSTKSGFAPELVSELVGLLLLLAIPLASAQMQIGDNTKLKAGGMFTAGYQGDYGNSAQIESDHGLDFGFNGNISGSYYNPNFLSFNVSPYYNQSRDDSNFQSLTGASGVTGTANLFTGSHFPGSITYHDDRNSTGTFGLVGEPNFTTHGNGQGFGIGWSALLPGLPTLSVGFSEGSGSGTVYGTTDQSGSSTKLFNLRSSYPIAGFHLTGFFDHNTLDAQYPAFLSGEQESVSNTSGHDFGFGANRALPINGSFYATYNRSEASTDYLGTVDNTTSYTTSTETTGATFHPTQKLSLFANESYTDNLSGYLSQGVVSSGSVTTPFDLGSGSHSMQMGGGAAYAFTNFLSAQGQATYYDQYYYDKSYTGTYLSGTVNYSRRLWNMFSFSAGVVDSNNGQGDNAVGFIGNVNYFHRIEGWETSGSFSYAQNVQSVLITYTTSSYNYTARIRRRLGYGWAWLAAYSGSQTGLTQVAGSDSRSQGYSSSLSSRRFTLTGNYTKSTGQSILTSAGLVALPPTPGVPNSNLILYNGDSYGGGLSATPVRRLTISGTFSRALSNTLSDVVNSRNNTEIFNAQLQYHFRRIGMTAGYTMFTQGISASGVPPGTANSYFIGVSRWFDFF